MTSKRDPVEKIIIYVCLGVFVVLAFCEVIIPDYKISPLVGGILSLILGAAIGINLKSLRDKNGK